MRQHPFSTKLSSCIVEWHEKTQIEGTAVLNEPQCCCSCTSTALFSRIRLMQFSLIFFSLQENDLFLAHGWGVVNALLVQTNWPDIQGHTRERRISYALSVTRGLWDLTTSGSTFFITFFPSPRVSLLFLRCTIYKSWNSILMKSDNNKSLKVETLFAIKCFKIQYSFTVVYVL